MNGVAILMMVLILGFFWGGFISLILKLKNMSDSDDK